MEANSKFFLKAQVRDCYARVVWTHKIHEKCADILNRRDNFFKLSQMILSILTTTGVLIVVIGDNKIMEIISAIISLILTFINLYLKKYNISRIAQKHSDTAISLWAIREEYLSLITDMQASIMSVEEIRTKRDELQRKLGSLYKGSPRTISKAYAEASKALKLNEELTFSDGEIDLFLPIDLRKDTMNSKI